jgi:hypothetical protein
MPNWKPLLPSIVVRLTPNDLTSERLTSAMRTCRLTCSGVAIFRRLMTLAPSVADEGLDQPLGFGRVLGRGDGAGQQEGVRAHRRYADAASGMARCSIWSTLSRFEPTRTLADHTMSPAALLA